MDVCQSRGRIKKLGWTYRFPLFLSLHPSQYSPSFNVAAWLRRREKGGRNFQEIPKNAALSVDRDGHVPFGVRDRNKYCVLLWLSCVMVDFEFCFVFYLFSLPPYFVRMGRKCILRKLVHFNSDCLLALSIWYVVKFSISNGKTQHNKCTLSSYTEGRNCTVGWF